MEGSTGNPVAGGGNPLAGNRLAGGGGGAGGSAAANAGSQGPTRWVCCVFSILCTRISVRGFGGCSCACAGASERKRVQERIDQSVYANSTSNAPLSLLVIRYLAYPHNLEHKLLSTSSPPSRPYFHNRPPPSILMLIPKTKASVHPEERSHHWLQGNPP